MDNQTRRWLIITGWAGLIGAFLVGVGEFTLQFSPEGGYEATDYSYFGRISLERLTAGHFISVFAAPLYVVGYWHLGQMFIQGGSRVAGRVIFLLGGYAFIVGAAWLGGRIYLALTVHEITAASADLEPALTSLLEQFARHNEPLVNALRVAMLVVSALWIVLIARKKSLYPRWVAWFSPIVLLGLIFLTYFLVSPAIGAWLLPAAMNVVHMVVFGLSLFSVYKIGQSATVPSS